MRVLAVDDRWISNRTDTVYPCIIHGLHLGHCCITLGFQRHFGIALGPSSIGASDDDRATKEGPDHCSPTATIATHCHSRGGSLLGRTVKG